VAIPTSTPTTVPSALTDLVVITRAEYNFTSKKLTVEASSSDEISRPVLTLSTVEGVPIGDLSGSGALQAITDTPFTPNPPAKVKVTSSNGGTDIEEVVIVQ
jgi:hypothetical protein